MAITSGILRTAFIDYLDDWAGNRGPSLDDVITIGREQKMTVRQMISQLWNCTNILPGCYCRLLRIQQDSTFAAGVRAFASYYGTPLFSQ